METQSALDRLSQVYLPAVEDELRLAVAPAGGPGLDELHAMLAYHMGWEGEKAGPNASGKRVRPLLLLLTCAAAGGDWQSALPAAAAIELIHNFSLIHDDIQDNSDLRRGRPTLWKIWGMPQAINAGDAMFTLAHLSMLRLQETVSPQAALHATSLLHKACLALTQGQYRDISYESRQELSLEDYWPMIAGKTAALLAASTEIGAIAARADADTSAAYRQFGHSLGLAFQAQDDLLGIWGDAALTGKSAESDLVTGKKSLPVLYGLEQKNLFALRWLAGPVQLEDVPALARQLELEGARHFTQSKADELTEQARQALSLANPQGEAGKALVELSGWLLGRNV
jgi:geranylgeranyl diphosphate synthase, type I